MERAGNNSTEKPYPTDANQLFAIVWYLQDMAVQISTIIDLKSRILNKAEQLMIDLTTSVCAKTPGANQ